MLFRSNKLPNNDFTGRINNPIHNDMLNIFSISLKYKEKPIEKENSKIVFNMGDSNATVNFFSGTGLNTGVANIKTMMERYNFVDTDIDILNNDIKNKSRRTIYNSLLSSQNPSYLSPIRKFTLTDGTQLGFYETKLSKNKTFSELQTIILNNLNKIQGSTKTNINDLLHSLIINFDTYSQSISIKNIITYFRYFTEIFDKMINITTNITGSVLHPLNSPNSSDNITNDLENIKKALYYNIYVCL